MWRWENAIAAGSTMDSFVHDTCLSSQLAGGREHQVPLTRPSPLQGRGNQPRGSTSQRGSCQQLGLHTQSQHDTASSSHVLQQPQLLQGDVSLRKSWQAGHAVHAGHAAPRHRLAPADTVACVPHQLRLIYKLNFTLARSRIRHRCWRSHPPPPHLSSPLPHPAAECRHRG